MCGLQEFGRVEGVGVFTLPELAQGLSALPEKSHAEMLNGGLREAKGANQERLCRPTSLDLHCQDWSKISQCLRSRT